MYPSCLKLLVPDSRFWFVSLPHCAYRLFLVKYAWPAVGEAEIRHDTWDWREDISVKESFQDNLENKSPEPNPAIISESHAGNVCWNHCVFAESTNSTANTECTGSQEATWFWISPLTYFVVVTISIVLFHF